MKNRERLLQLQPASRSAKKDGKQWPKFCLSQISDTWNQRTRFTCQYAMATLDSLAWRVQLLPSQKYYQHLGKAWVTVSQLTMTARFVEALPGLATRVDHQLPLTLSLLCAPAREVQTLACYVTLSLCGWSYVALCNQPIRLSPLKFHRVQMLCSVSYRTLLFRVPVMQYIRCSRLSKILPYNFY